MSSFACARTVLAAIRLAELRESRGLTQRQLAEQLGVSQVNVSRVERAEDADLDDQRLRGGARRLRDIFDDEQTVPLVLPATDTSLPAR